MYEHVVSVDRRRTWVVGPRRRVPTSFHACMAEDLTTYIISQLSFLLIAFVMTHVHLVVGGVNETPYSRKCGATNLVMRHPSLGNVVEILGSQSTARSPCFL